MPFGQQDGLPWYINKHENITVIYQPAIIHFNFRGGVGKLALFSLDCHSVLEHTHIHTINVLGAGQHQHMTSLSLMTELRTVCLQARAAEGPAGPTRRNRRDAACLFSSIAAGPSSQPDRAGRKASKQRHATQKPRPTARERERGGRGWESLSSEKRHRGASHRRTWHGTLPSGGGRCDARAGNANTARLMGRNLTTSAGGAGRVTGAVRTVNRAAVGGSCQTELSDGAVRRSCQTELSDTARLAGTRSREEHVPAG